MRVHRAAAYRPMLYVCALGFHTLRQQPAWAGSIKPTTTCVASTPQSGSETKRPPPTASTARPYQSDNNLRCYHTSEWLRKPEASPSLLSSIATQIREAPGGSMVKASQLCEAPQCLDAMMAGKDQSAGWLSAQPHCPYMLCAAAHSTAVDYCQQCHPITANVTFRADAPAYWLMGGAPYPGCFSFHWA